MIFFDYDLPSHLIAQQPAAERDSARLLVVNRSTQSCEHRFVRDLPTILSAGDLLIFNNSKVLPARLIGKRKQTGGKWECLFIRETDTGEWVVMSQTRGYPQPGETFTTDTGLTLTLTGRQPDKHWLLRPNLAGSSTDLLTKFGHIPLPPYIRKGRADSDDSTRYQTVYAEKAGSVAAPTAGLHFTPELIQRLQSQGINTAKVTLHVGMGTFAPITATDPTQHQIHSEWCDVSGDVVEQIRQTKARHGKVYSIGTTSTRSLESAARAGELNAYQGDTNIYIYPPYQFRVADGMLTNFHLPGTTLLLMVQAMTGSELLRHAYEVSIRNEYRFYSYGDAMLIL